jgi:quinol monooxygenase YgiN
MSFVFMVLHWPEPEQLQELAEGMREMREAMLAVPGCLGVDPPYLDQNLTCLVGISRWVSKQAFLELGLTFGDQHETVSGETRPRQRFFLEEA